VPISCDFTKLGTLSVGPKTPWYRVHSSAYGATAFNGAAAGNARFSPIRNVSAAVVPTIYAGEDIKTALMETVLHDVPFPSHGFIYSPAPPENRVLSTIQLGASLNLADLTMIGLKRVGLLSSMVIDGDKATYPDTRKFAEAMRAARPDIAGAIWDSRQTKRKAIVLFGDRLGAVTIVQNPSSPSVSIDDDLVRDELTELLEQLGASSIL